MQHPDRPRSGQRGQVLVIVAAGALTFILLMGLVLDGGMALFNRRAGQNTSDVMALAATKFVADVHRGQAQADPSITTTYEALSRTAAANDCAAGGAVGCTWQAWFVGGSAGGPVDLAPVSPSSDVPAAALGVRVEATRQPKTFVVSLIGVGNWDVGTQATAIAQKLTTAPPGQLLPIALKGDPTTAFQPGQVYDLTDGKDLPGGFGYLSWTNSNDPNSLSDSICTPDSPLVTLPSIVDGDPGKSNAGDVRACIDKWIASKQTVLIPIYSTATGHGNGAKYTVIGVAAFVITSRDQPAVDNIQGYFVEIYNSNPIPGGTGAQVPGPTDTSFSLGLVR